MFQNCFRKSVSLKKKKKKETALNALNESSCPPVQKQHSTSKLCQWLSAPWPWKSQTQRGNAPISWCALVWVLHCAARACGEGQPQKDTVLTRVTNAVNTRSILMLSSSLDVFKQILIIFSIQGPEIYCLIVLQRKLI